VDEILVEEVGAYLEGESLEDPVGIA